MLLARSILLFTGAAVSALAHGAIVSSKINCITAVGPESVAHVKTVTLASTLTVHLDGCTTTSYVPATITARRKTRTETRTTCVTVTKTENTVTDTYTSTSTATESSTITVMTTDTEIDTQTTTTTTTSTSTVPSPDGFVPVTDTETNGFPSKRRRNSKSDTTKGKSATQKKPTRPHNPGASEGVKCKSYPQSVRCQKTVTDQHRVTVTATERGCTRTIKPTPITKTTTKTITSTSTEVPRASTTVTTTQTTTVVTTTTDTQTTTSTTTSTSTATATAVAYEACSADNIISSYNGQSIINAYNNNNGQVGGGSIYDNASASSAEDCCILCINTSGCEGSYFQGGRCVLLHNADRSCTSQSANEIVFVTGGNGGGFTVSNGLCGYNQYSPGS